MPPFVHPIRRPARPFFSARIAAKVSNLTDKTYFRQYGFYDGLIYGEPRSYSVTLRARI